MELLKDKFGRKFPYIRLSITDVCNFKCGYCLPNGFKIDKSDNRTFLSLEEIKRLAKGLSELGVSKIRLTGGEPTIRKDFYDIVKVIKKSSGINKTIEWYLNNQKWLSLSADEKFSSWVRNHYK